MDYSRGRSTRHRAEAICNELDEATPPGYCYAGGLEPFDVAPGADAALADEGDVGGDPVAEPEGQVEVGDEPAEVAVVDPDEVGPGGQDAGEVGLVVELDQGRHAQPAGPRRAAGPASRRRGSRRSGGSRRRRRAGPRRPGIRR